MLNRLVCRIPSFSAGPLKAITIAGCVSSSPLTSKVSTNNLCRPKGSLLPPQASYSTTTTPAVLNVLQKWMPRFVKKEFNNETGDYVIVTTPKYLDRLAMVLRYHSYLQFTECIDIATIDQPGKRLRFMINYILRSYTYNRVIFVRVQTDEITPVPTVSTVWSSANWSEREVWDLFGVYFVGHTDLRRILTDYGFKGHPLRKDFPLTGFVEKNYNDTVKACVYEPVEVAQDYRNFYFNNPWLSK